MGWHPVKTGHSPPATRVPDHHKTRRLTRSASSTSSALAPSSASSSTTSCPSLPLPAKFSVSPKLTRLTHSLYLTKNSSVTEILWSFSIFLESVAILPQLFMLSRTGEAETITTHYLFALGAYRALYIPNWVYRSVQPSPSLSHLAAGRGVSSLAAGDGSRQEQRRADLESTRNAGTLPRTRST